MLSNHPQVEAVSHPALKGHPDHELYKSTFKGAGRFFTFEIKGGADLKAFIDGSGFFSANVADVKSLVIHPAAQRIPS